AALDQSLAMTRVSQGRFDVTVGPLVELWRATAGRPGGPDPDALADTRRCVGSGRLTLVPPRGVRLSSSCLHIDLGGIGKGIAVGRAIDVLRAHGISNAIVNGGGSTLMAMGGAPGQDGWPVQAAGLHEPLMLRDRALSTSEATAEVIAIGPGRPEASRATVSVLVENPALADALSTALLLSTVSQGREILRHVPGGSAWWTLPDGTMLAVAGTIPGDADDHDGATR